MLLKAIADLLDTLKIKYVIAHGNLLEYYRNAFIYHDDDIDIRMEANDIHKWERFCSDSNNKSINGIVFDDRFTDIESQKVNGIQCTLTSHANSHVDIHADLVFNKVKDSFWTEYDIDYSNLRKIRYLGVHTYAPSLYDTVAMLLKEYGSTFMTPTNPWKGPVLIPRDITPSS